MNNPLNKISVTIVNKDKFKESDKLEKLLKQRFDILWKFKILMTVRNVIFDTLDSDYVINPIADSKLFDITVNETYLTNIFRYFDLDGLDNTFYAIEDELLPFLKER